MGKMRFGNPQKIVKDEAPKFTEAAVRVMEKHSKVFEKLSMADIQDQDHVVPEKVIIEKHHHHTEKVVTKDKLARRHGKLLRKSMDQSVADMAQDLATQDELFHTLKRGIHNLVGLNDAMAARIQILEARKPEEIHTVTEIRTDVVTKHEVPKLVWIGIGLALLTNAFILIAK
jgi:hypothetical protein